MSDAQTLFREGVTAIREQKNLAEGRKLLTQSLRLEPNNDMAWLWLSRTVSDLDKKRQCLERALAINPNNPQALALKQQLDSRSNSSAPVFGTPAPATAPAPVASKKPSNGGYDKKIESHLQKAEQLLKKDDTEGAIEQWVEVLHLVPDHEVALGNAVRYLSRLKYMEDAKELVWRALDSGTEHPSVYMTAADILRLEGKHGEAEDMRRRLARLPKVDDTLVVDTADYFARGGQAQEALEILLGALENQPNSQKILVRLGDLYEEMEDDRQARKYYDLAARQGLRTKEGKLADKRLSTFAPALTDKERGSMVLAVREAAGLGLFFLLLAWQDAGLDLVLLGPSRWLGVGLSLFGGYLLVTATSSAQQQPLARLLGGQVPEADEDDETEPTELPVLPIVVRGLFGLVGMGLLVLAFYLVANTAIGLVTNPNPPEVPMLTMEEVFAGE